MSAIKEYSPIRVDIRNIAEAQSIIIDQARHLFLTEVDWEKYGATDIAKIESLFQTGHLIFLRNSPNILPLTVLFQGMSSQDDVWWSKIPPSHYVELTASVRLTMMKPEISPEEASLLRDSIVVNLIEGILDQKSIAWKGTKDEIIADIMERSPVLKGTAFNYVRKLIHDPHPIFPLRKANS